ncbi:MAG: T9SS type A sorting domain-containing protein [Bacteroidia bacterium]|nr:T9SS type A sorting domain-containing protein [Bacteroidia bacterium]MCZ2277888.1 T9SS type A sorting domain-containing protein [Bacteroidia bacterium]
MKRILRILITVIAAVSYAVPLKAQLLLNPTGAGGFELGATFPLNGWNVVNGGTNDWYLGAPGANTGLRGAYISNNGGASASYNTFSARVSHFYRDIAFPTGQATLSFDWKCYGENGFDYMDVFLCPTAITPVANFELGGVYRVGRYNLQSTWQNATVVLPCNPSAQTLRLVFSWKNDFIFGTNPPGVVDNISVFNNPLPTTGLICANAVTIPSLPFSVTGQSTVCMVNNYTSLCGFSGGEDKVYVFTATSAQCLGVTLNNTNTDAIGFSVYNGCPSSGGTCVGFANVPALGNSVTTTINLPAPGTYYFIVDGVNATFDFSIVSYGSGPVNDMPCTATFLPFGIYLSGNNTCSGSADEPGMPGGCGTWGTPNTVWYRFIAPPSGCVKVKTVLGTLSNTIIAAYRSGVSPVACGSGATLTYISCNDNEPTCGSFTPLSSALTLSGLTPGYSYYIVVDGIGSATGSFSILAIDGGAGCSNLYPATPGQDCSIPNPICANSINIPNPGYQGVGNICDFGTPSPCTGGTLGCGPCATSCLCSGERGSSWYKIQICAAGFLEFWIVPNNWPGPPSTSGTDYDFAIYGPNPTCSNLTSPIRCHYSALGVTGVYGTTNGTAPPGYPGFGPAFRQRIAVNPGEIYLLNVSNYAINTSGFTLIFPASAPVCYGVPPGGTVVWTGNVSTDWFNMNNWGGCQIPDCERNAMIPSFPANQPVIGAAGAACLNVDINPGASLVINSSYELQVCGDFNQYGSFSAQSNSTVRFENTVDNNINQFINGTVTSPDDFWHVQITKPVTYSVTTNQDIDMSGNFTVANTGGAFSAIGKYHKIGGNFIVNNPGMYNSGTVLEFNGTVQNYLNRGTLNDVTMNQSGAHTLTLLNHGGGGAWMLIGGSGILTLNSGIIITDNTANNRVEVQNRSFNAITPGNVNSYIETNGNSATTGLRKYLNKGGALAIGTYEFPVGTLTKGYQRLSLNLTTGFPSAVNYVTIQFEDVAPASNMSLGSECGFTYHAAPATALDNGYWVFRGVPSSVFNSGTFTPTLYNTNYTNPDFGFTVMYNRSGLNLNTNWLISTGLPVCANPVTAVQRTGMSVATVMQSAPQFWFGTAQAPNPLPVELLSFNANERKDFIRLEWVTASEKNNQGYDIERSSNGPDGFSRIGFIKGNGSVTTLSEYGFDDKDVKSNVMYFYRLKQIDFSGEAAYSDVVAARISNEAVSVTAIPNPYQNKTIINYSLKTDTHLRMEVFNSLGQKVTQLTDGFQKAGAYQIEFSAKKYGLAGGIYLVRVITDNESRQIRIIEED